MRVNQKMHVDHVLLHQAVTKQPTIDYYGISGAWTACGPYKDSLASAL